MRILFVTPYPPSRVRVRSFGFVTHLAKEHKVKVLALCLDAQEMADAQALKHQGITITTVYEPRIKRYIRGLCALPTSLPLQVAFDASSQLRQTMNLLLKEEQYDLVHVEFIRALGSLPDTISIPTVWDAVDCVSQLYKQGAQMGVTRMMRYVGSWEAHRVRKYEYTQLQRFQHVLVTSERERQALLKVAGSFPKEPVKRQANITVLPHGIDQRYFQPYVGVRKDETLIFVGKMSFHANIAAVLMLVRDILPLVWRQRPNVRLIIAGSSPPSVVRRLAHDLRIQVTGYLPDLRPIIGKASIAVCPLPYAVGMQNKVLEAMALSTPVITTTCVAEGLSVVAGCDVLIADTPLDFASAILQLLDDRGLRERLSEHGLRYIAAHHNWDAVTQRLIDLYTHALNM